MIGWIIGPIAGIAAGEEPQSVPWFTLADCAIHAPREYAELVRKYNPEVP